MELTINGQVFEFHFGMGFMREINKKVGTPVDGLPDVKKNIGLQYMVACLIDGDMEALSEILIAANKGKTPRVTAALIDSYIDEETTDVDALFDEVLDFLKKANATKKIVVSLLEAVEKERAKE